MDVRASPDAASDVPQLAHTFASDGFTVPHFGHITPAGIETSRVNHISGLRRALSTLP
ncbi:MAG: hypothetical protein MUC96_01890 [Myxococcaceae bacterium]|jgi:hypothetical protein|nr:hypothetical protein [Myxococcaceae bacterium]